MGTVYVNSVFFLQNKNNTKQNKAGPGNMYFSEKKEKKIDLNIYFHLTVLLGRSNSDFTNRTI